jgi:hypothetical protein
MQRYYFRIFLKEHGLANQFYGLLFCACALSLFGFYNFCNTSPFRPHLCYIRLGIRMMDAGCDSNSTATSLEVGLSKTKNTFIASIIVKQKTQKMQAAKPSYPGYGS